MQEMASSLVPDPLPPTHAAVDPQPGGWSRPRLGEALLLMLLVAMGLWGRVVLATRSGIWRDEGTFLFTIEQPSIGAMLDFLRTQDSHPPLHYLVSRLWANVFGTGEAAALAFPVLLGVLLIPVIWWAGTRLLGPRTGLAAAALVALSPGLGEVSALVRPYAFMTVLVVFSVATLWQALMTGERRDWGWYAVATLALLLAHNWAWLVWGSQMLAVAGWAVGGSARPASADGPTASAGGQSAVQLLKGFALACVVIMLGYALWLPSMREQLAHAGHSAISDMWAQGFFATITNYLRTYVSVALGFVPEMINPQYTAALVLVTGAAFTPIPGRPEVTSGERLALWILLAVPAFSFAAAIVLSAKTNLLITHCYPIVAPCMLLLLAHAGAVLAGAWHAKGLPGTAALVLALLVCGYGYLMRDGWTVIAASGKSNAREVARFVTHNAKPEDLVIVAPIWEASSFNFYFRGPNEQRAYPDAVRRGEVSFNGMGPRMANDQAIIDVRVAIDRAKAAGRRVWFVTEPGYASIDDRVNDGVQLPADYQIANYNSVAFWRTSQVLRYLKQQYGQAFMTSPAPTYYFMPYESQAAMLFTLQ